MEITPIFRIPEYFSHKKGKLIELCRECQRIKKAKYYATHRVQVIQAVSEYAATHKEKISKRLKGYRDLHKKEASEYQANYHKQNPDKLRSLSNVRRARKKSLPATYGESDYASALEYFHGTCAYCGNTPSLFDYRMVLHEDHFIPLNSPDCPGTIPQNMLPSCQNCNLSKGSKNPVDWITEKFGKPKGRKILKRIEEYFQSLAKDDDEDSVVQ